MLAPMKAFGSQILAELIGCRPELLNQADALEALLAEGISRHGLELKALTSHQFEPAGVTAIAIIGASHVAIHTYPEARHLSLDIFTCQPGSPGPAHLLGFLQEALQPERVRFKELHRGQRVEVAERDYVAELSRSSFDLRYRVSQTVLHTRTALQEVLIIDNPDFGRMLFLDRELQLASADVARYHDALLAPLQGVSLERVAVLGGGDGGVLRALLDQGAGQVWLADLDPEVTAAVQVHLPALCGEAFADARTHWCQQDAAAFIAQQRDLDVIVSDLVLEPERLAHCDRSAYLAQLVMGMALALRPQGVLSLQLGPALDQGRCDEMLVLLRQAFAQVSVTPVLIPSFAELWLFAVAREPRPELASL